MKMIIEPEKAIFSMSKLVARKVDISRTGGYMITSIFPSVMFHVILELNFLEEQFKRKIYEILR